MTCNCITKVDDQLKAHNARLEYIFVVGRQTGEGMSVYPRIPIEKVDKSIRGKAPTHMLPTFCPFCGVRYQAEKVEAT